MYKNPQNKQPLLQYYKTLSILAIFYNALSFKGWERGSWKLKGKISTNITKRKTVPAPTHPQIKFQMSLNFTTQEEATREAAGKTLAISLWIMSETKEHSKQSSVRSVALIISVVVSRNEK